MCHSVKRALSGQRAARVVCGNLKSSGHTQPLWPLWFCPVLWSYKCQLVEKIQSPFIQTSLGKWKCLGSLIILYGFLNQIQAQKRRVHLIKIAFIFLTDLKQVGFIVLIYFKHIWNSQKKKHTAVGLVFLSHNQKMSDDRKDRERLLGNHSSQEATEENKYCELQTFIALK